MIDTKFKNGDYVTTRPGMGMTEVLVGRVVGYYNPAGMAPAVEFYTVLLNKRIEGFPWSAVMLSGALLDKLEITDRMARIDEFLCPNCSED